MQKTGRYSYRESDRPLNSLKFRIARTPNKSRTRENSGTDPELILSELALASRAAVGHSKAALAYSAAPNTSAALLQHKCHESRALSCPECRTTLRTGVFAARMYF